ncbi:MAG TPA: PIG-L family deacetylase, partial [Candidatus Limnocylindria bacterium]|nr:PIG-L family deacetylase [Candidatus Limnocylindria bacterium]
MTYDRTGGMAVILAHPADEAFTCAGSLALAHDAGETTRLLIVTRGEAGNPERTPDADLAAVRESEMVRAAEAIGLNEVTLLEGYPDGAVAAEPTERLIQELFAWLGNRRPDVLVTFGSHGVTGDPDHVTVGSAARWAVERLARQGVAPNSLYVIAP